MSVADTSTAAPPVHRGRHPRGPETVELLCALMDRMRAHFTELAAEYDLTPQQASTLHQLDDEDGLPMSELAAMLHCDASNITGIADRLESAGLVERHISPADRRVKALVATPAGRRVRAELAARLSELPPPIAALTEADRHTLVGLLRTMVGPPDPS